MDRVDELSHENPPHHTLLSIFFSRFLSAERRKGMPSLYGAATHLAVDPSIERMESTSSTSSAPFNTNTRPNGAGDSDPLVAALPPLIRSPFSHLFPSCSTVTDTIHLISDAFRELSILGRCQIGLLLANLVITFILVYIVASDAHKKMDTISLYFGLEFIIVSTWNIIYTVCVENTFAFYALIVLQVEVVTFVTASAFIGVLSSMAVWAKWVVVLMNWGSIITFLLLQRAVRRSWGWHAYRLAGVTATAVKAYSDYQQFAAVLLLDFFHAIFFITAEDVVRMEYSIGRRIASYYGVIGTVILARVLQVSVRYERRVVTYIVFICHTVGLGVYIFFAVLSAQSVVMQRGHVRDDGDNISANGERTLVTAVEWCTVLVRLVLLSSVAKVLSNFNGVLPSLFPRRAVKQEYLIDASEVEAARHRATSTATSPRAVRMFDANVRVATRANHTTSPRGAGGGIPYNPELDDDNIAETPREQSSLLCGSVEQSQHTFDGYSSSRAGFRP